MDNLGIGVMTSIRLKDRYESCKSTWLKDFDNVYLFGGNIPDENLIPIVEAGEDWASAFLKQQLGLKYMYNHNPNYDWYSISGCDNVLFKENAIRHLSNYNPNDDLLISQLCGTWCDSPRLYESGIVGEHSFTAIGGGASFFISNSLMKKCSEIIDEFNEHWTALSSRSYGCSDVALSLMVKRYFGVNPTESKYMFGQHPKFYEDIMHNEDSKNRIWYNTEESRNFAPFMADAVSFHYIKPDEMESIYKKYSNKK